MNIKTVYQLMEKKLLALSIHLEKTTWPDISRHSPDRLIPDLTLGLLDPIIFIGGVYGRSV